MIYAFGQIWIFCEFGESMSNRFSKVDNMIYFCNWYAFPKEIQRMLPIIMVSAQAPITLTGYSNLSCLRDSFKKVTHFHLYSIIP